MAELLRRKARLKLLLAVLEVPREAAGTSPERLEAWMLARLLSHRPDQTGNLLAVREILFAGQDARDRFPPWFGRSLFALTAWDPQALTAALGLTADTATDSSASPAAGPPEEARSSPRGAAHGASPSAIRLRLRLPAPFFPQAGERLLQYLAAEHAPATFRRAGAELLLQPGPKALKRKVLLQGSLLADGDGLVGELTVGPRFRLRRYLDLFPEPEAWRRALVEVLAVQ
jgi:hypothetical protein